MLTVSDPPTVPAPPAHRYSHVARVDVGTGALVFVSGQVALGDDGTLVGPGDMAAQSERVFALLEAVLAAEGATFADLVSIRTYVTDMRRLADYGAVRARYLADPPPTSTTVAVAALFLPEALVEVEVVAAVPAAPAVAGVPAGLVG
jgi:enamine deaminase RidA (YjgF/YER057c/UK114 family)